MDVHDLEELMMQRKPRVRCSPWLSVADLQQAFAKALKSMDSSTLEDARDRGEARRAEPARTRATATGDAAGDNRVNNFDSIGRWRGLLNMSVMDEELTPGETFKREQQDRIAEVYAAMGQQEQLLFCMGLNAFVSTMMMDFVMIIRSVEMGHVNSTDTDAEDPGAERDGDEAGLMQRPWQRRLQARPVEGEPSNSQFEMRSQTFVAALERLPAQRQMAVAQAMKKLLQQKCGLLMSSNARALEAVLVVHGEGDSRLGANVSNSGARVVVNLGSQSTEKATEQAPPSWTTWLRMAYPRDTLDEADPALIDKAMSEELMKQDARERPTQEFAEQEERGSMEVAQLSQWLEACGVEQAQKRAAQVAERDRHRRVLEEMAETSARFVVEAAEKEVEEFNAKVQSMSPQHSSESWVGQPAADERAPSNHGRGHGTACP